MTTYDVSTLKAKQDELESRKTKLLESFRPFRNELIKRLEQFIDEATQAGLKGVKPLQRKEDTAERFVATVTLNEFDLVLVATDGAYSLRQEGDYPRRFHEDALAAKILIYSQANENYPPNTELVVRQTCQGPCDYYMGWFTTEGPKPIWPGEGRIDKGAGEAAAEQLVQHFYSLERWWKGKPSLRAMLEGKGQEHRSMGFRIQE